MYIKIYLYIKYKFSLIRSLIDAQTNPLDLENWHFGGGIIHLLWCRCEFFGNPSPKEAHVNFAVIQFPDYLGDTGEKKKKETSGYYYKIGFVTRGQERPLLKEISWPGNALLMLDIAVNILRSPWYFGHFDHGVNDRNVLFARVTCWDRLLCDEEGVGWVRASYSDSRQLLTSSILLTYRGKVPFLDRWFLACL